MGWTFERNYRTGRMMLCCDDCGKSGGVRKFPCPFGWCQAYAFCPECAKKHKPKSAAYRERHRAAGCEKAAKRSQYEHELRESLMASGKWVRKAAVNHDGGVKVWFKRGDEEKQAMMSKETYRAIPLITPATIDDYRLLGDVVDM